MRTIQQNFDFAAQSYEGAASIQRQSAQRLAALAAKHLPHPPSLIVDIGTGTGFCALSCKKLFPQVPLFVSDLSFRMVQYTQKRLLSPLAAVMDLSHPCFKAFEGLLISNMALQWSDDLTPTLDTLWSLASTFAFSLPLSTSFEEWHQWCDRSHNTCALRPLPDFQEIQDWIHQQNPKLVTYSQQSYFQSSSLPINFAQHLKAIGAQKSPYRGSCYLKQARTLDPEFQGATYKIGFFMMSR